MERKQFLSVPQTISQSRRECLFTSSQVSRMHNSRFEKTAS